MLDTELFDGHRRLLFDVAYRMTGSVADAEDLVQEAWLRWSTVDPTEVRNPKAYLVRTITNLSLNQLTSARARRERYVGPWLPEPLLTQPDASQEAEMAESVSMAMLVVLETLSPLERAVFLLHDVFETDYPDVAETLHRSEAACRQLAARARFEPRISTMADDLLAKTGMVAAGLGVALVPDLLVPSLRADLPVLRLKRPTYRGIYLISRTDRTDLGPLVDALGVG